MSGMSYIEIVKWENEYRSEEQITMARTEIFSSYDVLHQNSKTLKERLDELRAVVARADLYAAQATWTQTGRLWVRTIQALDTNLQSDVKELADCPDPELELDCVSLLPGLLTKIEDIAQSHEALVKKPSVNRNHALYNLQSSGAQRRSRTKRGGDATDTDGGGGDGVYTHL